MSSPTRCSLSSIRSYLDFADRMIPRRASRSSMYFMVHLRSCCHLYCCSACFGKCWFLVRFTFQQKLLIVVAISLCVFFCSCTMESICEVALQFCSCKPGGAPSICKESRCFSTANGEAPFLCCVRIEEGNENCWCNRIKMSHDCVSSPIRAMYNEHRWFLPGCGKRGFSVNLFFTL